MSVGRSVGSAFVRRSTRRTLLAYLALFFFCSHEVKTFSCEFALKIGDANQETPPNFEERLEIWKVQISESQHRERDERGEMREERGEREREP